MAGSYEEIFRNFSWDIPECYNLGTAMSDTPARRRDGTAVVLLDDNWHTRSYSFSFLRDFSNKLANRLLRRGCKRGDRIAVLLPASVEAAVAHIAILKAGMISVPLIPNPEISYFDRLIASGASAILTDGEFAERHAAAWANVPHLMRVEVLRAQQLEPPHEGLTRLLASERSIFHAARTLPDEACVLSFTSGSEGAPKGVLHSHHLVLGILPVFLFTQMPVAQDVVWSHFEWGWLGGLLVAFGAWHQGSAVLVQQRSEPITAKTLEMLRRLEVSRISIAPTALKILRHATRSNPQFPRLSSITSGGEKLDVETCEWVKARFGTDLCEIYGLTECSAVLGSGNIVSRRPGALGKPAPGHKVHIVSETGERLNAGEEGLIAVESPHPAMFAGYWRDPQATRDKFIGNMLNTGDIGLKDEDGYFWYRSRADDLINSAGRRISPAEIEDVLAASPPVQDCAVVSIPDPLAGEIIVSWVTLKPPFEPSAGTEQAIFAAIRGRLASYQLPRRIRFRDTLPQTPTGKIHRRAIREEEIRLSRARSGNA